jgi:2-polyprenyl-6-methoxyphenol hydroxylase-like FAD-dependent oxidoreductase
MVYQIDHVPDEPKSAVEWNGAAGGGIMVGRGESMPDSTSNKRVLISGGGIAGLTLGILLYEKGWQLLVIERDPTLRTEGYMMDFFGTGWDVAERIGIVDALRGVKYPIDYLEYVNNAGKPYASVPISRVRRALGGNYVYLRRSDLETILFERAKGAGLDVRFGAVIRSLEDTGSSVEVEFEDGSRDSFSLVFGADGVHSKVRELAFGPEEQFARFLDAYVAAFHSGNKYSLQNSFKMFEEPDHLVGLYPLSDKLMTGFYVFRSPNLGYVQREKRLPLLKERFQSSRWVSKRVLENIDPSTPIFFDSLTQILMPKWSKGRIALLGDACGCLTLVAGQGSHMAMGDAYVIARELERYSGDYQRAFQSYETFLKPIITSKQNSAARFSKIFVPTPKSRMWLRRLVIRLVFSRLLIGFGLSGFGSRSVLERYN